MTAAGTSSPPVADGRHRRGQRTRAAVTDAVLALLDAGEVRPSATQIAEVAGVSIRSVYHHFDDLETLFAAVAEVQHRRIADRLVPIPTDLPLEQRIARFVAQRADVLEALTPIARASSLQEPFSAQVQAESDRMRRMGVADVEAAFAPELAVAPDGPVLVQALAAVASWRTWEAMRSDHGLDRAQATDALRLAVHRILTPPTTTTEHP